MLLAAVPHVHRAQAGALVVVVAHQHAVVLRVVDERRGKLLRGKHAEEELVQVAAVLGRALAQRKRVVKVVAPVAGHLDRLLRQQPQTTVEPAAVVHDLVEHLDVDALEHHVVQNDDQRHRRLVAAQLLGRAPLRIHQLHQLVLLQPVEHELLGQPQRLFVEVVVALGVGERRHGADAAAPRVGRVLEQVHQQRRLAGLLLANDGDVRQRRDAPRVEPVERHGVCGPLAVRRQRGRRHGRAGHVS